MHPTVAGGSTKPVSLLLVDDHEMFREGLAALINAEHDLRIVAQAADGGSALEKLLLFKPRIVLVDVSLPDMNGADLARKIRNRLPDARIIALSMHAEPQFLELMLREGASAYVVKNDAFKELVAAIRNSLDEARPPYLSKSIQDASAHLLGRCRTTRKSTLSRREEQVLRMLADGLGNKDIAEQLSVSSKTVDTYRRRVMEKLDVRSNADLVKKAIALGLTQLE